MFNDPSVYNNNLGGVAIVDITNQNAGYNFLYPCNGAVKQNAFQSSYSWLFHSTGTADTYTISSSDDSNNLDFGTYVSTTSNSPARQWKITNKIPMPLCSSVVGYVGNSPGLCTCAPTFSGFPTYTNGILSGCGKNAIFNVKFLLI